MSLPLPMCDCGWNVYDCQCRYRVRREHALASMRAMVGTLAFAASYERGYRNGLQDALHDGCGALNYLRQFPDEP